MILRSINIAAGMMHSNNHFKGNYLMGKMKYMKFFFILSIITSFAACNKLPSTPGPDEELQKLLPELLELDALIHPSGGSSPNLSHDALKPLSFLGNSTIVGLGEATHGTREFFQMKHRIFKYLVEKHNFKIFGFEADMGESYYLNRYVIHGEGSLNNLMNTKMHFWTWKTQEVRDLLEWMRKYNEGRAEEDKIHYIGFDNQFLTYQPDLLLDYFNRVKPEYVDTLNPFLNMITSLNNKSTSELALSYSRMDANRKQEISDSLDILLSGIDEIENELISSSSNFEYQYMRQLVRNMQQVNDVLYNYAHNQRISIRDQYMAENAMWLSGLFGANTKTALWAHNGHVGRIYGTMGTYLKETLGEQYQTVGFTFSTGSFYAFGTDEAPQNSRGLRVHKIDSPPPEGSLNHLFNLAKYDNFMLSVADIPTTSALGDRFELSRPYLMLGSVYNGDSSPYYRNVFNRDLYDVLIHFDKTTAARRLNIQFTKGTNHSPDPTHQ